MERTKTIRSAGVLALTAMTIAGLYACVETKGTASADPGEVASALEAFTDGFDTYSAGRWREGSTHGRWTVAFDGHGSVDVKKGGGGHGNVVALSPAKPKKASETHSALVRSVDSLGDLDVQVSVKTETQLRRKANPWEVGWFVWHYTDDAHFYYVVLKPNGWELGKRDPAYPGGQRYLATGGTPAFPIGVWRSIRVQQTGNAIAVSVDGRALTSFTDTERPYTSGSIALYSEDSVASYDDVNVNSTTPTPPPPPPDASTPPPPPRDASTPPTGDKVHGVTVDSVDNLSAIVESLKRLPHKPTTRIVFDENVPATSYTKAATQIQGVSYVMGELLDSFYVKTYSTSAYLARTDEYLSTLGDKVDIWEVGNEINGEWLGDTATVAAKMTGAYDKVKAAGKTTGLTLYYNAGCYEKADHEMFTWAQANVPQRMKDGLDYVLVSYYEDDCNGRQPDWQSVFTKLGQMFPNSKLGIGECGTSKAASKAAYITRYYGMNVTAPRYVGGYFWWYFKQDGVPYTSKLFPTFVQAMQ
jgi:hypothetical protein